MKKELELEAEKNAREFATKPINPLNPIGTTTCSLSQWGYERGFIAGATSKYVERQKLEFAIEQLNKLDSVLQSKIEMLNRLLDDSKDSDNREYFRTKISGVRLAKEEIRRDIKELEQKLSEL